MENRNSAQSSASGVRPIGDDDVDGDQNISNSRAKSSRTHDQPNDEKDALMLEEFVLQAMGEHVDADIMYLDDMVRESYSRNLKDRGAAEFYSVRGSVRELRRMA